MQQGHLPEHVALVHDANVHRQVLLQQLVKDHLADDDFTGHYEVQRMRLVVLTDYHGIGTVVLEVRYRCQLLFYMLRNRKGLFYYLLPLI